MKYYSVERLNREYVEAWKKAHCKGADVLDYCCGNGYDSRHIAKTMAPKSVVGIDISDVSIDNCSKMAQQEGLSSLLSYRVMDAEELEFADNSFDVVIIYGVLHHLDLEKAFGEIKRVLRPGGKAIATEALIHNPFIHAYRKRTPDLRTVYETEHILGRSKILGARRHFGRVSTRFFNLATLAAVPFRKSKVFPGLLACFELMDRLLLSVPGLKWWAWMCVFVLSEPKKD